MQESTKYHPAHHFIYLAFGSLLVIGIFVIFGQAFMGSYIRPSSNNNTANTNNTNAYLQLGYDPLITMVPKESQTKQISGKVLVSTLDPKLGSLSAKAIVMVWSNFTNADTKDILKNLKKIKENFKDEEVVIIWKDYANPENKESLEVLAAISAHCANSQGKFFDYADLIFNNQNTLNADGLKNLAEQIGLNTSDFSQCYEEKEGFSIISSSYYLAKNKGIESAPAVYVNEEKIDNPSDIQAITDAINKQLEKSYVENK